MPPRPLELIPPHLAEVLADAAGLRNVLVHLYEKIDYEIVAGAVDSALRNFAVFLGAYSKQLDAS